MNETSYEIEYGEFVDEDLNGNTVRDPGFFIVFETGERIGTFPTEASALGFACRKFPPPSKAVRCDVLTNWSTDRFGRCGRVMCQMRHQPGCAVLKAAKIKRRKRGKRR